MDNNFTNLWTDIIFGNNVCDIFVMRNHSLELVIGVSGNSAWAPMPYAQKMQSNSLKSGHFIDRHSYYIIYIGLCILLAS